MRDKIMTAIHGEDCFRGYDPYPHKNSGMSEDGEWESYYGKWLELTCSMSHPKTIIEVGSWEGKSAIKFAECSDANTIICVDTWLGGYDVWKEDSAPKRRERLRPKLGYPTIYQTFIKNLVHAKAHNRVVPIPQTSLSAAKLLKDLEVKAELVYIDGSHEYPDVLLDLEAYWPLVAEGGIMFGDDFFGEEVNRSVREFSQKINKPFEVWNEYIFYVFLK